MVSTLVTIATKWFTCTLHARVLLLGFEHVTSLLPSFLLSWYRLVKIKEWVDETDPHATIIPFSASLELKV